MESAGCPSEADLDCFDTIVARWAALPEDVLALEILEGSTGTAPTSLSAMLTGWLAADRNSQDNEAGVIATLTEREANGDITDLETPSTAARTVSRAEEAGDAEVVLRKENIEDMGDGLFNDPDFDDSLSQET